MHELEICVGCDAEAEQHPIAGIRRGKTSFEQVPVCAKCWQDPAHRKRNLKMHFFARGQAEEALAKAGSSNIG